MPWSDGLDEATIGHAGLQGWKPDGNAEEIARAAVAAHLQASKIIGADPKSFLKFPADDKDVEGWAAVHERLGVPKTADDYKFDAVKFGDGTGLDAETAKMLRDTAAKLKLTSAQAAQLATDFAGWTDNAIAEDGRADGIRRAGQEVELRQSWGANYDAFKFSSDRAAALLELDAETVTALEGALGVVKFREKMRVFAERLGEARLADGGGGGGKTAFTREEAVAERTRLMADPSFVKRYMDGDREAAEQMMNLQRAVVGAPL